MVKLFNTSANSGTQPVDINELVEKANEICDLTLNLADKNSVQLTDTDHKHLENVSELVNDPDFQNFLKEDVNHLIKMLREYGSV